MFCPQHDINLVSIRWTIFNKITDFLPLSDDPIFFIIAVVGIYPNIPHKEGLIANKKDQNTRKYQTVSTDSLTSLAECLRQNIIFEHDNFIFIALYYYKLSSNSQAMITKFL